ncbi:unnamed protein product [Rhizoctonia solani]|uniref:Uncharacterized protein n=1 Tax=Rhizoctonia solani TaxID=456999 RepID=A0A8H3A6E4_9AGAM|nr:unnamed protein product [Rhizoctonia solani]CAE6483718.1 unnamed protein product [Rhizoctonia solani]
MSSLDSITPTPTTRTLAGIPTPTGTSDANGLSSVFINTTVVPSPTNGGNNGNNGNGNGNGFNSGGGVNSTLYLFTFLTTLLLLLAVSCGIVIRSFVLRRRFHRRVEEAIAAGVLLPGQGDVGMGPGGHIGTFRRPIGEKPKMWEVWINPSSASDKYTSASSEWSNVQPLAVTQISEVSLNTVIPPKIEMIQQETPTETPLLERLGLHSIFRRDRSQTRVAPNINPTPLSPGVPLPTLGYSPSAPHDGAQTNKTSNAPEGNSSVQVAVFVAMPDPSRPRYVPGTSSSPVDENGVKGKQRSFESPSTSTDEHEIPEICIGISQAQVTRETNNIPNQDQTQSAPKP